MQIKNSLRILALSIVASTFFVGCGGGSDSSSNPPAEPTALTGTFIDAPVQGLSYKTPTQSGFTDASGHFKYEAGETIEFKLGNLLLGKGVAGALVTPYTISDNNNTATNIALLLQNFDNNRTDNILNISALKDYNLSNFNISDTNANLESRLTTLLATGEFQTLRGGTAFGLLDSGIVKNSMDSFLANNSVKYDKKFTQAFLDHTVVYRTSSEYPQYKNKFIDGKIYFAGDDANGQGWDSTFSNDGINSTYTLQDGIIHTSFSDGHNPTYEITEVTDNYLLVTGRLGSDSRVETWYTSKEAAENAYLNTNGFNEAYLRGKTFYQTYVGEAGITTYAFSNTVTFTDKNSDSSTFNQELTGFQAGDGVLVVKDGKLYEFTYDSVNGVDVYNNGINIYTITSIDKTKIVTSVLVPESGYTANWYFNENDAN